MKICEDCIKQDVCKFKDEVEEFEKKAKLPEPIEPIIECKYKRTENYTWTIDGAQAFPCGVTPTTYPESGYIDPGNDCTYGTTITQN